MNQPRVSLAALLREITQWPVPKKKLHQGVTLWTTSLTWLLHNYRGFREMLQVLGKRKFSPYLHSVITKSWSEVMIRLSTTKRRPILGRSSPLSRQKKSWFKLFQMHLRQVELYNLRVLTTCKLYAFQHKQVRQKITASYWDKKKSTKLPFCPNTRRVGRR